MQVFVTGGSGLIGRAVLARLRAAGHAVQALARSTAASERVAAMGARPVAGDLRRPGDWAATAAAADAVVHLGCTFDTDMAATDAAVLDALLARLGPGQRLVYTGGTWLFGDRLPAPIDEATPLDPMDGFGWMAEGVARVRAAPLHGVAIHPARVFAADAGPLGRLRAELRAGGPARVVGDPELRWPLVHADDLADLYLRALERAPAGAAYCAAGLTGVPVRRLIGAAAALEGRAPAISVIPLAEAEASMGRAAALGEVRDQAMCSRRARTELGWDPKHPDLPDGPGP
jgi:nucleoside-diphosphate-sugar epimerase